MDCFIESLLPSWIFYSYVGFLGAQEWGEIEHSVRFSSQGWWGQTRGYLPGWQNYCYTGQLIFLHSIIYWGSFSPVLNPDAYLNRMIELSRTVKGKRKRTHCNNMWLSGWSNGKYLSYSDTTKDIYKSTQKFGPQYLSHLGPWGLNPDLCSRFTDSFLVYHRLAALRILDRCRGEGRSCQKRVYVGWEGIWYHGCLVGVS